MWGTYESSTIDITSCTVSIYLDDPPSPLYETLRDFKAALQHQYDWFRGFERVAPLQVTLPTDPVSARLARRLQPGNLLQRRRQKLKRHAQEVRA